MKKAQSKNLLDRDFNLISFSYVQHSEFLSQIECERSSGRFYLFNNLNTIHRILYYLDNIKSFLI